MTNRYPALEKLHELTHLTKHPAQLRKDPDTGALVLEIEDTTYVGPKIEQYIESALKTARRSK